MKKAIVTGATGFIGRHCLARLQERGFEVHAVGLGEPASPAPSLYWHQVDLLDSGQRSALMAEIKPTHALHFAWYVEPGLYLHSRENLRWVNASLDLIELFLFHGGQRLVMAGSCFEYDRRYGYCSERLTPLSSQSLYSTCKRSLGEILESVATANGLSSAWGRIFFLYGPHEHPRRLVSGAITAILNGNVFSCSHGGQIRDFLHVGDVAGAFAALLDSKVQGPVNIASGIPVTIREVVSTIGRKLNGENLIRWGALPIPPDEPPLALADVRRLRDEVQWEPTYDLDAGLEQTIAWWKKRISKADE